MMDGKEGLKDVDVHSLTRVELPLFEWLDSCRELYRALEYMAKIEAEEKKGFPF